MPWCGRVGNPWLSPTAALLLHSVGVGGKQTGDALRGEGRRGREEGEENRREEREIKEGRRWRGS